MKSTAVGRPRSRSSKKSPALAKALSPVLEGPSVASPRRAPSLLAGVRTWREAIDRVLAHSELAPALCKLIQQTGCSEYHLVAPVCAAHALETYQLLPEHGAKLHLALLGAEKLDHGIEGRVYQLLPSLLGRPDLSIELEIVGPQFRHANPRRSRKSVNLPAGRVYRMSCGEWLKARPAKTPLPQVTFLFHPGFENHAREWLKASELPQLLRTGTTVIVFAYDEDEAERDAFVLKAHGAQVTEPRECVLGAMEGDQLSPQSFAFARASFGVRGYGSSDEVQEEPIEAIERLSYSIMDVINEDHRREHHVDAFRPYWIRRGRERRQVAHVFGALYYDPEREEVFLARHGCECPGFVTPLALTPPFEEALAGGFTPLARAMLAASIFRNMRG